MKKPGSGSLASRLGVVLDVVIVLMVVSAALEALLMLGLVIDPTSPARHLLNVTTLYHVPPGLCDAGDLVRTSEPRALLETSLLAYVNYRPGGRWGVLGIAAGSLGLWALYFVIVLQLRRVLGSLTSGQPFLRTNVARLRVIGWTIIAAALYRLAFEWAAVLCMRAAVSVADRPPAVPLAFALEDVRPEILFVGAAVLALAEIFRVGADLHDEQALTI